MASRHYGPDDWSYDIGKHELTLEEMDTSWNPASTKNRIHGPCKIEYRIWEDGGIDFVIKDRDQRGAVG